MPLAIALAINSAISVYYYLGILKAALIDEPEQPMEAAPVSLGLAVACFVCIVGVIGASFSQTPLYDFVGLPTAPPTTTASLAGDR
jgi:NADH:ubiquinone oxidoreductase subunit 2 (subunit N)